MKQSTIVASASRNRMIERAREASERSVVPYSGRPAGAAILSRNGVVYAGAVIEDASGSIFRCAESAALAHLVASGGDHPIALTLYAPHEPKAPCADCMRLIREIAGEIPVYSVTEAFLQQKAASF